MTKVISIHRDNNDDDAGDRPILMGSLLPEGPSPRCLKCIPFNNTFHSDAVSLSHAYGSVF